MAGFDNEVVYGTNVDFTGNSNVTGQVTANGQLLIGSAIAPNIQVGTLTAGTGITITNGPGSITIASSNAQIVPVYLTAISYSVQTTDYYIGCTAGSITITLPNSPATGQTFIIKDQSGTAAGSNITVTVSGGIVNIDSAATYSINTNYGSISVIWDGTKYYVY